MTKAPDQFLLNELLWDGKTIQDLSLMFCMDEDKVIRILQPDPITMKQATAKDLFFPGYIKECTQDLGFSKREIIQSIEHLPNKEEQMEKNGYWLDVFHGDDLNSRYLKARRDRERDREPLDEETLLELMGIFVAILSTMSFDLKKIVNNDGQSKEDYLQEITLNSIERGRYGTRKAINHQINRSFKNGF